MFHIRVRRILMSFCGAISLGLFLHAINGSASANTGNIEKLPSQQQQIPASSLPLDFPTGPDNIDTPLTEYVAFTGSIEVANAGISFFPIAASNSFVVAIPACENGQAPTFQAVYLEWYQRWRGPQSMVDAANNTPTFDNDIDVVLNGGEVNTFSVMMSSWARFNMVNPTSDTRVFIRRSALTDITDHFAADWVAGDNLIAVSELNVPTPTNVSNSNNYGVGLHAFYECPEFEYVRVGFSTGLDWFYGTQDQPYAGDYSDLACFEFPAVTTTTQVDLDAILGGQANERAPFRGARLFYESGNGAVPIENSAQPAGPSGIIVNGGTQIGSGYQAIWTSSLGLEWDQFNADNGITINPGDEWVCLQGESARGEGSAAGMSGDLFSIAFSIPIDSDPPTDWGDLPDLSEPDSVLGEPGVPVYHTDIFGSPNTMGPSHPIIPTLHIGNIVDAETNGQADVVAIGDDLDTRVELIGDARPDDEDGIELQDKYFPNTVGTFTATVTNSTGEEAYLHGFVDWNGNGQFQGVSEVIRKVIPTGSVSTTVLMTYSIPVSSSVKISTNLGVRFRLSTDAFLGPNGPATNGEVEDYIVMLSPTAVDLIYFTASRTGRQQATVRWATETEIDNFGFRVLRSSTRSLTDAEEIAFVASSLEGGNGPGDQYRVIDDVPDYGTYTYWLVDLDTAGIETLHGPSTILVGRDWRTFMPLALSQ